MKPYKTIKVGYNVTSSFLGIPFGFKDVVTRHVEFDKSMDRNSDYFIPISSSFNKSEISVQLNFDFTETIFRINYVGIGDVLASIGGLSASLMPIVRFGGPFLALLFLI